MYKLRELSRKDIIQINVWRNDQDLIALLGAPFRYINLDVDTDWFEAYMGNRENTIRCAVVQDASDEILGLVSLTGIDWVSRSAEFHIMIGNKENRRHGIGMFATRAMHESCVWKYEFT